MKYFSYILMDNNLYHNLNDITKKKYSFPFFEIDINNKEIVSSFYHYIYDNATIWMNRKRKTFEEVLLNI